MAQSRIIDQTTDSVLSTGDYVIVDSQSEGTRKFDLGSSLNSLESNIGDLSSLQTITKTTLVAAINEAIDSIQELQNEILDIDNLIGNGVIE